ncbi:MAG: AzlD domain-containing protein [Clostridia bacterium]|nr:AzlD domain-containing protein [Clostridia bacterium]
MSIGSMLLMVAVMAGVTYLIRMIPFVFFRKKIKSTFIKSLLYYIPYAVLSAMTFPFIFYSTGGKVILGLLGTVGAVITSIKGKSLITVALVASAVVLLAETLIMFY